MINLIVNLVTMSCISLLIICMCHTVNGDIPENLSLTKIAEKYADALFDACSNYLLLRQPQHVLTKA